MLTHFLMQIPTGYVDEKNAHKKFLMAAVPYALGQHYTIIVGLNASKPENHDFSACSLRLIIKDRGISYIIYENI